MILHASVVADQPQHTAETLAAVLGGVAFPLPGPGEGTWAAVGPGEGNLVEVLRRGSEFHPNVGGHVETRAGAPVRHGGFHLLLETPLGEDEVLAIARERGAEAFRTRHGFFDLIEFWIDGALLIEFVTAEMSRAYRAVATYKPTVAA